METEVKETQNTNDKTCHCLHDLGARAKAFGTAAWERAKGGYSVVQDKTVACAKNTDEVIRSHPYQSLGIAFGAGVLIGLLIKHSVKKQT